MSTLEALYFPGTRIFSGSQFPALLLFKTLHLIQPVEEDETTDNAADIFTSTGRCQAHTPSLLGENRERFLRLIRDIRERKDDYAAQLSALTVASLSAKKAAIDDTPQGIITSLLGHSKISAAPEEKEDVELWQARLVLKIAEILDSEEEEVAMQMALLDDDEDNLFKTLQGELEEEEETLFEELQQLKEKINRPSVSTIKNRLQAWNRIRLAGEAPQRPIWLTHLPEAADILLERCTTTIDTGLEPIAELPLPAHIGWSKADALAAINNFEEHYHGLIAEIGSALDQHQFEMLPELTGQWSEAVDAHFPTSVNGRTILKVYLLSDTPCGRILGSKESLSGQLLAVVQA